MTLTNELPVRDENHIRETSGYHVLVKKIPSKWMIRNVDERDYGVDCYIELIDEQNHLTGEVAFIQLKASDKIKWRKRDSGHKFTKMKKSTTNYLRNFKIPTYLFYVDLSTEELYFMSIKEYIMEHYKEYLNPHKFNYDFNRNKDFFTIDAFLKSFRRANCYDQFRNELLHFISDLPLYIQFMQKHNVQDGFFSLESKEMMCFEAMHRNISFLQDYFGTVNRLTPIEILKERGKKYSDVYMHTIYEEILTEFFNEFKVSVVEVFDRIKELITEKESYYWAFERHYVLDLFNESNDEDSSQT